jgi:L-threonylcarbamoyladenylate synthase
LSAPRRIDVRAVPAEDVPLDEVLTHLRTGGLLGYPTETVYGFGCALRAQALARLAELKSRGEQKPFLLLIPSVDSVRQLAWTDAAHELASVFWPGAVTLLLRDPQAVFPGGVRSAEGAVAVRRSGHPLARRLVEALGEPITSTSANAPGEPPATSGKDAFDAASRLGASEAMWIVDAGPLPESEPSTIVDCTGPDPKVLRVGATPVRRLRCVIPHLKSPESDGR